jgi:hypothetical protein
MHGHASTVVSDAGNASESNLRPVSGARINAELMITNQLLRGEGVCRSWSPGNRPQRLMTPIEPSETVER